MLAEQTEKAEIFASLPYYPMFSNGPWRLSPPPVHPAVHNSGSKILIPSGMFQFTLLGFFTRHRRKFPSCGIVKNVFNKLIKVRAAKLVLHALEKSGN